MSTAIVTYADGETTRITVEPGEIVVYPPGARVELEPHVEAAILSEREPAEPPAPKKAGGYSVVVRHETQVGIYRFHRRRNCWACGLRRVVYVIEAGTPATGTTTTEPQCWACWTGEA